MNVRLAGVLLSIGALLVFSGCSHAEDLSGDIGCSGPWPGPELAEQLAVSHFEQPPEVSSLHSFRTGFVRMLAVHSLGRSQDWQALEQILDGEVENFDLSMEVAEALLIWLARRDGGRVDASKVRAYKSGDELLQWRERIESVDPARAIVALHHYPIAGEESRNRQRLRELTRVAHVAANPDVALIRAEIQLEAGDEFHSSLNLVLAASLGSLRAFDALANHPQMQGDDPECAELRSAFRTLAGTAGSPLP